MLMSLSVILLLSIALMKTFEKRSVEVAHLGNNLERFQTESLSRSVFKVILISIKERGLFTLLGNQDFWKGVSFPIGNGSFKILEVTPIDHLFNLNRKIKDDDPYIRVFTNLVTFYRDSIGGYDYLTEENILEALSAIIDWTDRDQDMDEIFRYDSEQYYSEEPSFIVKNRRFDRLSEVRLLPAFRALGISDDFLEKNFRVFGGTGEETGFGKSGEYINVNLIGKDQMEAFLLRYQGVEKFATAYNRRDDIMDLIIKQRPENQGFSIDPRKVNPPFPAKDFKRDWTAQLKAAGINLNEDEKLLFQPYSEYLLIKFQVQVGRATVNIRSIVQIKYRNITKSLDMGSLNILSFRVF